MRLIVGLGNPGTKYAQTRHNVGWLVVDELAKRARVTWKRAEHTEVAELRLNDQGQISELGQKVLLVKPQTFMNKSGQAVRPLIDFYRLEAHQLLVIQDDLDSPFGLLKLRGSGRHGGQNGLRDIIRVMGYENFARLKIGISRPPAGRDPADWVLSKWHENELKTLEELLHIGQQAAASWAVMGLTEAQSQFNGTDLRPKPAVKPVIAAANSDTPKQSVPKQITPEQNTDTDR